jgi:tripeptide aminopeptidase
VLSPSEFPHLRNYIGQDIIVTDGTTLLGADDKAGVAEIMTAVKFLLEHPEVKHGTVKICFTPDEEVGRGVDRFDTAKFGAAFAYTVDGGEIGELNYENFNAAAARIKINGKSIHTGDAKGKMKNAVLIGMELNDMLPPDEIPANTEGYEGFYHINNFVGNVDHADAYYLIRDFDKKGFEDRKNFMNDIAGKLNAKYGTDTVSMDLYDQYYNMKEIIEQHMYAIDIAKTAMQQAGVQPLILPIRGGTDGARLSYMGLPTPNIFTGGHNFHGRYEYIPVRSMQKAVEVIVNITINCCTYPWPS